MAENLLAREESCDYQVSTGFSIQIQLVGAIEWRICRLQ